MTKPSGKEFAFQESEGGLHYLDRTCPQHKQKHQGHVFTVNTEEHDKQRLSPSTQGPGATGCGWAPVR